MSLPNTLTMARFVLTFLFILLVLQPGIISKIFAAIIFAAASFTDFFDGYFAKKYNLMSNFGKLMDPIADKFLVLSAFFIFVRMDLIAAWMFFAIFFREALITGLRLAAAHNGKILAAEKAGKFKTVSQMAAIGCILAFLIFREFHSQARFSGSFVSGWQGAIYVFMMAAVFLTLVSGALYLWNNRERIFAL